MRRVDCPFEADVLNAVYTNRWPERVDAELRVHVIGCAVCADVVTVAKAIEEEFEIARAEARVPESGLVWWRAQMRARQEAAVAAERPITIVHALAIAAGAGLMLSLVGYAVAGLKGSSGWFGGVYQSLATTPLASVDLTSRWVMLPITAMLVSALVATVAAYFIYADE
jgi:hypothetical protein